MQSLMIEGWILLSLIMSLIKIQTATTNAFGALSDSTLKVLKATLNGNLTLGDSNQATLAFYGKDALGSSAKIIGGGSGSSILLDGSNLQASTQAPNPNMQPNNTPKEEGAESSAATVVFDFNAFKGFKGSANVMNATLKSALEDQTGLSVSYANPSEPKLTPASGSTYDASKDGSSMSSFQMSFNGTKANEYPKNTDNTDKTDKTDGASTPSEITITAMSDLSQDAQNFIQNYIASNGHNIDMSTAHHLDQNVGYTNTALTLNFIGSDSLSATKDDETNKASGVIIANDNINNTYNFIDFGKIDTTK